MQRTTVLIISATFLFILVLVSTCFTGTSWADPKWTIKFINDIPNSSGIVGEPGIIAVDSKNNPHIFYTPWYGEYNPYKGFDESFDIYLSYDGTFWTAYRLNFDGIISRLTLALDSHLIPHVVCYRANNKSEGLMYASWTGTNWTYQTIDNGAEDFWGASLAFDANGNPHIAYMVSNDEDIGEKEQLNYAVFGATGWNIKTIDKGVDLHGPTSLGIDSAGNAHVIYSESNQIAYAVSNLSGWNKQVIADNATFGNMVLDSHGNPHFIYISSSGVSWDVVMGGNSSLMYSEWNGSVWNTQNVAVNIDPNDDFGFLALDSQDQPHIDYLAGGSSGSLAYASLENGTWNTQIVGNATRKAGPLAIDSNGNPHISYGTGWAYGLSFQMYATTAPMGNPDFPFIPGCPFNWISLVGISTALAIVAVVVGSVIYFKNHPEKKKLPAPNSP